MTLLDGPAVRAWAHAAQEALAAARDRIDAVNVFPVADSDTGTNLLLTVTGGAAEAAAPAVPQGSADGADVVARAFARGALLAARGNSGVIVSQYLAGLAESLPAEADGAQVAQALAAAANAAARAVADPQEGTVLTLARVMAEAATSAADAAPGGRPGVEGVLRAAAEQGRASLGAISAAHPQLRAAHVLDAGACGLLVLVESLARVVMGGGDEPADLDWLPVSGPQPHTGPLAGGAYEVMLLVRADPAQDIGDQLRARMQAVGDSVAVVGSEGVWNVHVHTDAPARAIDEAAVGARDHVVVRLLTPDHRERHAAHDGVAGDGAGPLAGGRATRGSDDPPGQGAGGEPLGVVVCTSFAELAATHASAGAVVVVRGDAAEIGVRHVERAITDAGSRHVVLLPGDAVTADVARSAARSLASAGVRVDVAEAFDELRVLVGLLALHAGSGDPAGRIAACAAALARLRTGAVGQPDAGALDAGALDAGVLDGELDRLVAEHGDQPESLTVLLGGADDGLCAAIEAAAERHKLELTVAVAGSGDGLPGAWLGVD
ncbi:DAK2 domain-containing protein [Cellulomonas cellasea]|uniref:DAK2 domain-containing protein n=1 Tax=Cellulomonas cellasea TaxID=43670 RepID=UPI0025A3C920|nr:DAK2 domain-containing protein [Cellulomonas cellasea]MDM8084960.1 DAK2 domain-containing protein [Cellulomonas cellasea]